jgi:hypothetical protein
MSHRMGLQFFPGPLPLVLQFFTRRSAQQKNLRSADLPAPRYSPLRAIWFFVGPLRVRFHRVSSGETTVLLGMTLFKVSQHSLSPSPRRTIYARVRLFLTQPAIDHALPAMDTTTSERISFCTQGDCAIPTIFRP